MVKKLGAQPLSLLALSFIQRSRCSDRRSQNGLQKFVLETCESAEKQQYAPEKDCWQCNEQYTTVFRLPNFEIFYNQKNRCSSARLENSQNLLRYVSRRKIQQTQAKAGVHPELKSLGTQSYAPLPSRGDGQVHPRPCPRTTDHWFANCDQKRPCRWTQSLGG